VVSVVDFADADSSSEYGRRIGRRPEEGGRMKYLALIYGNSDSWDAMSSADQEAMRDRYRAFAQDAGQRGALVGGFELDSATTATTLRSSGGGDPIVTDGPFAETKEQLGGYFLLECGSLDDAIELASNIPAARNGGAVEIRPVLER
jgi:hypothetical protein